MKCPRCGSEMVLDTHRKIPLEMCYECGYIEGRSIEEQVSPKVSNYEHMKTLNFNELVAFLTTGLDLPEKQVSDWLLELTKK